ncbi:hypothetical protein TESG_03007 [Trichophyton tonsurans CBS 112818]|uniref:Uncharacterized protein n=2 Tax=Trichophyton TaxID=5550 RepID=F2PVB2_TRIEC|nr:hypothetical protein TESG_03007 [Trichophyton tonsurans CBS 112818]EGE05830.1 hypothetical protein TEQG_04840 [Trichophyton equinum CBS 127.97]
MAPPPVEAPPKSRLTLGLEVEFYAALKASAFNRILVHGCIASLLGERLRQLRLSGPDGFGSKFKVVVKSKKYPCDAKYIDYAQWTLTTDATAQPQNPEWFAGYESQPIEIISPPYWALTTHWENDLQRIFSSRMGQYNPISARELCLYYELNNTTSIHVHVGNGVDPDSSFPFHTVRNLAMILLVYEPAMDRLLDAKLYPLPTLVDNRDRSQDPESISSFETPYFQPPNLPAQSPRRVLARHLFNTCMDIRSVIRAMSPLPPDETLTPDCPWYYKFNFNPLLDSLDIPPPVFSDPEPEPTPEVKAGKETSNGHTEPTMPAPPSEPQSPPRPKSYSAPKRKSPTIEFRQQIGTLDPDTMIHWIRFLTALVEFSSKLTDRAVVEFLGLEDIDIEYFPSTDEDPPMEDEERTPYVNIGPPTDPSISLSALALLTSMQPIGSLARLLTAMESVNIDLDAEITRHWKRKVSP